jgi:hypothetical protein
MVEFGVAYGNLVRNLKSAALQSGCRVRGFADMSVQEVAEECEIPLEQAAMAKARLYDEPFKLAHGNVDALALAIEQRFRHPRRRFHHITGRNDKADAVSCSFKPGKFWSSEDYRSRGCAERFPLSESRRPSRCDGVVSDHDRESVPRARIAAAGPQG